MNNLSITKNKINHNILKLDEILKCSYTSQSRKSILKVLENKEIIFSPNILIRAITTCILYFETFDTRKRSKPVVQIVDDIVHLEFKWLVFRTSEPPVIGAIRGKN